MQDLSGSLILQGNVDCAEIRKEWQLKIINGRVIEALNQNLDWGSVGLRMSCGLFVFYNNHNRSVVIVAAYFPR